MSKLIIHIGTHKTGTTSIQNALDEHQYELFNNENMFVFSRESNVPKIKYWLYPEWYGNSDVNSIEPIALKEFIDLEKDIGNCNAVYSEENFSDEVSVVEQKKKLDKLLLFINESKYNEFEIHVFFREQAELINSIYLQRIRNRSYNYSSIEDFIKFNDTDFIEALDWNKYLDLINNKLSLSNKKVIVIPHLYHDACAHSEGMVKYFFERVLNSKIQPSNFYENKKLGNSKNVVLELLSLAASRGVSTVNIGWFKESIINTCLKDDNLPLEAVFSDKLKTKVTKKFRRSNSMFLNKLENDTSDLVENTYTKKAILINCKLKLKTYLMKFFTNTLT